MRMKLSFPVGALSGKMGGDFGLVAFVWRGLQVARELVVPANPSTTEQDTIRGYLATAAAAYQDLTAPEKLAWDVWAEVNKSNIMGQMVVRPAISEYCAINCTRQIKKVALTDVAPTSKPDWAITGITSYGFDVGPVYSVIFTHNKAVPGTENVMIRVTNTLASARVTPKDSDYRLVEGVANAESITTLTASPQTIDFDEAIFNPANNDWVGVELVPISSDYTRGVAYGDVVQVVEA